MYRKFWLINQQGEIWQFTNKSFKSFLQNPQGLGYQSTLDVSQYGEALRVNRESFSFPRVSGDLQFYDTGNASRYDMYNKYVKFCMYSPLTLCYEIDLNGSLKTFKLPCYCTTLTKTESKTNKLLTCPVEFFGLGFWQGEEVVISSADMEHTIVNDSDFPVGFRIKLECADGVLMHYPYFQVEKDGTLYGEAKLTTITNFWVVDSSDGRQDFIIDKNPRPNPLEAQDLSISNGNIYVTFVKLARGTSKITVGCDEGTITNVEIRFLPAYRSV